MSEHEYPTIVITENEVHESALSATGTVVRQFSDEQPALVHLGLRNETAQELAVYSAPPHPFPAFRNRLDDPHRMYLIDEDEEGFHPNRENDPIIPDAPDAGCWRIRPTGGHGQSLFGYPLPPGESKKATYVPLADTDATECLPRDEYHFDGSLQFDDAGEEFNWTVTMTIQ